MFNPRSAYNRTYLRYVRLHAAEGKALTEQVLGAINDLSKAHVVAIHAQAVQNRQHMVMRTVVVTRKRMAKPCTRCSGTGKFITGVVNGIPVGPGGDCFRCAGKGVITLADARRNYGYDNYAPRAA